MGARFTTKAILILLVSFLFISNSLFSAESDEYTISNFLLHQKNWDNYSLSFDVFATDNDINFKINSYKLEMFAEDGSLLKTFRNVTNFSVNDKNLGSKEKINWKLTVEVGSEIITKETNTYASEKSVIVKNEVNIPLEDHISIGSVYVNCRLMRRSFDDPDRWQKIGDFDDVGVTLFVSNGLNKDYVEVPINKRNSNLDLATFKYFDDLKIQIERDLIKTCSAEVKYYYQFNWDRNVYVVYGGSKNISKDMSQESVYVFSSELMQKLVTVTDWNDYSSVASAE